VYKKYIVKMMLKELLERGKVVRKNRACQVNYMGLDVNNAAITAGEDISN
jgi:hypothetical protein